MALGFALLVAWLLVMALVADVLASDGSSELAANPELAAAGRYARTTSQSAAMAANPELSAAGRYIGQALGLGAPAGLGNSSSFLAANPEVMTARGYGGALSGCSLALAY